MRPRPLLARRVLAAALAVLATLAGASLPRASAEDGRPGGRPDGRPEEPWEKAIRAAIVEQDSRIAQTGLKHLIARLEASAHRDPGLLNVYLLSRAYGKAKQYDDALAEYGEVLKLEPRCYFAHRDMGMIHRDLALAKTPPEPTRLLRAEAALEQARRLKPGYVDALRPLAEVKLHRKDYGGAASVLQTLLDVAPADHTARVMLAEAQHSGGRLDDALRSVSVLLSKEPRNPSLRHLQARILVDMGDHARAMGIFRDLALENPDIRPPVDGYLFAASKKSPPATLDEYLWGLERLLRLARSPDDQRRISKEIERLRSRSAGAPGGASPAGGAPAGPPDAVAQVRLLNDPDEARRLSVLRWLWHPGPPGGSLEVQVVREGLLRRLVPAYEPVPAHRKWALRVIGKYGGPALVAPVRHSLLDPDPEVRLVAADAIGELKSLAGIAALARYAQSDDPSFARAARTAVYRLANAPVPRAQETPAAQAAAFRAWWDGPETSELKLRVVDAVLQTQDLHAEQLLVGFALEPDPAVARAAYRGLQQVATAIGKHVGPRADWLRSLPSLPDSPSASPSPAGASLAAGGASKAQRDALAQWWSRRPPQ